MCILIVENIQYCLDISRNDPVWTCSLSKGLLTEEPDHGTGISDIRLSLLKAEIANKAACHVFVIFQTKKLK